MNKTLRDLILVALGDRLQELGFDIYFISGDEIEEIIDACERDLEIIKGTSFNLTPEEWLNRNIVKSNGNLWFNFKGRSNEKI